MVPTSDVLQAMVDLLAADTATLAPAVNGNKLHLAKATFSPSLARVIGDLTEADYGGYAALVAGTGTQGTFTDPQTGERVILIKEPAGGWHFPVTSSSMLPQTIYGFYLTDNGSTTLLGCELLPQPILLTASGQAVEIGDARFRVKPTSVS